MMLKDYSIRLRKGGFRMGLLKDLIREEDGIGVVEIILILVILIGLVIIFKDKIEEVVTNALDTIISDSDSIIGTD